MRVQQAKCSWKRLLGTGGLLGSAGRWEEMLLIWSSFQSVRRFLALPISFFLGPQSLSQALHSPRSLLCRGLTSLLTIHDAESPGMNLRAYSQQDCRQRPPPPSPRPRPAAPEGLCLLPGELEVVPSQCPAQTAVVLRYFVGIQSPPNIHWVAVPQAGTWAKKLFTTKNMNPSWIWTSVSYVTPFRKHGIVCFPNLFPAIQEKKEKTSESEVRQRLLQEGNSPSLWTLGSWGIPKLSTFKDGTNRCPGRGDDCSSWDIWSSPGRIWEGMANSLRQRIAVDLESDLLFRWTSVARDATTIMTRTWACDYTGPGIYEPCDLGQLI